MKKNILEKIYIIFLLIYTISFIVLALLGNKNRIGYIEPKLNLERTIKLNNNLEVELLATQNISDIEQYIINNNSISNYAYTFRISYYTKIFRNSDLYGVYIDIDDLLQKNDFFKDIDMWKVEGTPYGDLVSSINLNNVKIDANYKLKVRTVFFHILILLYSIIIIYFLYNKINFDKLISRFYSIFLRRDKISKHDIHNNIDLDSLISNIFSSLVISFLIVLLLIILKVSSLKIYFIFLLNIVIFFYVSNVLKIKFINKIFNTLFYANDGKSISFILTLIFILYFLSLFLVFGENIIILIINLLLSILLILFLKRFSNNYFSIILAIIAAILSIYKKYVLAITDVYHHTSHFTSAFFINNGIPYQENMYSVLGHYAILMEPFFKIFGFNVETYSILLDILFAIALISIIITIFILIKNPFYINIALLLLLYCYFTADNERPRFTVFRMFFPSIMILYISIINTRKNILLLLIGYLLSSLAILFNPESGLICLASLVITNIYTYCYDCTLKDKKLYINTIFFSLMSLFSLIISFIILNVYNVYILGGEIQDIKSLLFPLLSGQVGTTNSFHISINNIYMLLTVVFILVFFTYFYNMNIFKKKQYVKLSSHYPILIYISILALGLYAYNMNRYFISNNVILFPMLVIVVPFILNKLDDTISVFYNNTQTKYIYIRNTFLYLFMIIILFSGYVSFSSFSNLYSNNFNKFCKYLKDKNYEENGVSKRVTEYMKKYGYDGIVSFGGAFVYGYANLGWTNSLILPNESDWWNPEFGYSNAVYLFLKQDPDVFLSGATLENMSVYYYSSNDNNSVLFFNNYVSQNYTNIKTEYEKYNLYFYQKIK